MVQFGWIMCSVLDLNQNYHNVLTMVLVFTIVFIPKMHLLGAVHVSVFNLYM